MNLLELAHQCVMEYLTADDLAVDATVGNGHDTVFLATHARQVYGFDIQAAALQNARQRLRQHELLAKVSLIHASHAQMLAYLPPQAQQQIKAIMFNLGYLPGGDKTLITQTASTLAALQAALACLGKSAVLTVLSYPGHAGGDSETQAVAAFCHALPAAYQVEIALSARHHQQAPRLFIIRKNR